MNSSYCYGDHLPAMHYNRSRIHSQSSPQLVMKHQEHSGIPRYIAVRPRCEVVLEYIPLFRAARICGLKIRK